MRHRAIIEIDVRAHGPLLTTMLEPEAALAAINGRHGMAWQLVGRLAGGHTAGGAYELHDAAGARAVLKVYAWDIRNEHLHETARLIEQAIAAGWRTPGWLAHGEFPAGGVYVVRSFVDGEPATELGERELAALFDLNRRQAGLRPETERDWSSYVRRTLFEDGDGFAPRMRTHPDTARLLRRIESATAALRSDELPTGDVVHGDFTIENALFREGVAYVVDAEFSGKGTRAYDLATLLVDSALSVHPADARIIGVCETSALGSSVLAASCSAPQRGSWAWPPGASTTGRRIFRASPRGATISSTRSKSLELPDAFTRPAYGAAVSLPERFSQLLG